ncbi:uncharacterized protein A4U43_C04F20990 [Asparagus officinalis]|uniref:Uncharacterized protein n=1 Tax=Asparagus officinalis TaxID=4686 RepID=A0A5P1F7W9_ASPOF|nr:uncharacterized protein A4U43_C04F20990 [Asparagus officinalis]
MNPKAQTSGKHMPRLPAPPSLESAQNLALSGETIEEKLIELGRRGAPLVGVNDRPPEVDDGDSRFHFLALGNCPGQTHVAPPLPMTFRTIMMYFHHVIRCFQAVKKLDRKRPHFTWFYPAFNVNHLVSMKPNSPCHHQNYL